MKKDGRFRIPSTSTLIAFECAARLGSVTRAAQELDTSQSAISRFITGLERQLSVRLFDRSRTGITLTEPGQEYYDAVVAGLRVIHAGAEDAAELPHACRVVIACSHDASHLMMMPRYDALQEVLGPDVHIRLVTYLRHIEELAPVPMADIVLNWRRSDAVREDRVRVMEDQVLFIKEEAQPVCSPDYAAAHADTLQGPATGWGGLTLLDLKRPNLGWASWQDWFDMAGQPEPAPRSEGFDTYTLVLEAAAGGRGVALGWRYSIEAQLDAGTLVALNGGFVEFPGRCFAALTRKGRQNPFARRCLSFFEHFA